MTIALFIDGDNIDSDYCSAILAAAQGLGEVRVKKVFGRCATFEGKGWKDVAHAHGIQIYSQVNNLRGKSAADIALVIDAMKLLERKTCDGYVIASNDTDYTALVYEIKERKCKAYCLVSRPTENVYEKACDGVRLLKKLDVSQSQTTNPEKATAVTEARPEKPSAVAAARSTQPKKGTYRQIAVALKKMGCQTEKAIRNKIKSDYFKTEHEIEMIVGKMKSQGLIVISDNGHITWSKNI